MSTAQKFWAGLIGFTTAAAIYADRRHDGSSLCECSRPIFHTDTALGRAAFVCTYAGFTAWFVPHFLKQISDSSS